MMGYFPLCMDLKGKKVLLIGDGPQIVDKIEKLRPFGAELVRSDSPDPDLLDEEITFVVVGDTERNAAAAISAQCRQRRIPVNVVDEPELCSFFFPALIVRGDVTVGITTGGKSPVGAACLARTIRDQLPEATEEIIDWLHDLRKYLYDTYPKEAAREMLREAAARSFAEGRILPLDETL